MRLRSLSVFFPAYNEEKNITRMYESLSAVLPTVADAYEILVINDGSKDATGAIADGLAKRDPRVRPIHHETNLGYGAAVAHGMSASRLEHIFFTDGDNQFDVSQLKLLVPHAAEADAVIGYRINRQDNLLRRTNAWAWNRLVKRLFGLRVRDIDCAFKLVRKSAIEGVRLESTGAMVSTELLVKLQRARRSIKEIGIRHSPRLAGKQTGANPRVIARAFRELYAFRKKLQMESR